MSVQDSLSPSLQYRVIQPDLNWSSLGSQTSIKTGDPVSLPLKLRHSDPHNRVPEAGEIHAWPLCTSSSLRLFLIVHRWLPPGVTSFWDLPLGVFPTHSLSTCRPLCPGVGCPSQKTSVSVFRLEVRPFLGPPSVQESGTWTSVFLFGRPGTSYSAPCGPPTIPNFVSSTDQFRSRYSVVVDHVSKSQWTPN